MPVSGFKSIVGPLTFSGSHFKTRTLKNVATEMSLHTLAYNIKRAIALAGVSELIDAMQA